MDRFKLGSLAAGTPSVLAALAVATLLATNAYFAARPSQSDRERARRAGATLSLVCTGGLALALLFPPRTLASPFAS